MNNINGAPDSRDAQAPAPIPYTLRLGVTGHRQLQDSGAVVAVVQKTLNDINATLQGANHDSFQPISGAQSFVRRWESRLLWTLKRVMAACNLLNRATGERRTDLRWRIHSALAVGADRVVARSAMDLLQAELVAVLPFSVAEYRHDFTAPGEVKDFDDMLARSKNPVLLKMPYGVRADSISPAEADVRTKIRNAGYRRAGETVVESCEILLAIWDGKPPRGRGGTAEIVEFALALERLVLWIDPTQPHQPARWVTGIEKRTVSGQETWTVKSKPLPDSAVDLSPNFVQLAEYNRDKLFNPSEFEQVFSRNADRLAGAREKAGLDAGQLQPLLQLVLPHYARADQLAIAFQTRHMLSATWLYRLAALAVAVGVVQAIFFPSAKALTGAEILLLLGAVGWFRLSVCEGWHEKWLNYRHLAERLRTLMFTSMLPDASGGRSAPKTLPLPFYPGPGGWILAACDRIKLPLPPPSADPKVFPQVRDFLIEAWINDQATFHANTELNKKGMAHREHLVVAWMLGVTLTAALVHLLDLAGHGVVAQVLTVLAIALPAFAAAQHAIVGIHDYERIATRSGRMADILRDLERAIREADTYDDLAREIARAEEIMSTENHEWCVSLSYRGLSLPV